MGLWAMTDPVQGVLTYVQAFGPSVGPAVYVGVLAVAVIVGLPCTPLQVMAGFMFGLKLGVLCSVIGLVVGIMISYFIARACKDRMEQWGRKYRAYRLIQKSVDKGGVVSICVVLLIPMPLWLKGYGLGALGAPAGLTFLLSAPCVLPYAIAWAWAGAECKTVAEMLSHTNDKKPKLNVQYVVIGACLLALIFCCRKAAYRRLPDWVKEDMVGDESETPRTDDNHLPKVN